MDIERAPRRRSSIWRRVWALCLRIGARCRRPDAGEGMPRCAKATARAIAEVTQGIEGFAFNKAIAKLYEFTNTLTKVQRLDRRDEATRDAGAGAADVTDDAASGRG